LKQEGFSQRTAEEGKATESHGEGDSNALGAKRHS
jgi:hypothetical protein